MQIYPTNIQIARGYRMFQLLNSFSLRIDQQCVQVSLRLKGSQVTKKVEESQDKRKKDTLSKVKVDFQAPFLPILNRYFPFGTYLHYI